jgi:hypothetical protein
VRYARGTTQPGRTRTQRHGRGQGSESRGDTRGRGHRGGPGHRTRAAGLGSASGHALISLLALNGLRISEATGADIEHLGLERGHRTLTITRKGGKVVTIPLAPRTARALDLAIGERTDGPVFLAADGRRLDRHGAGRIVRRIARQAGIAKTVTPDTLRHAFITAALDAGVPLRDVQEAASHADPRTTMRSGPRQPRPARHLHRRRLRRRCCAVTGIGSKPCLAAASPRLGSRRRSDRYSPVTHRDPSATANRYVRHSRYAGDAARGGQNSQSGAPNELLRASGEATVAAMGVVGAG